MYQLKVIIVGAGIGGLTAGIALQQAGYEVEIYDKTKELKPAGAGITLWSNGVKVLNSLGLGDRLASASGTLNWMERRTHLDELLNHVDLELLTRQVGQHSYPIARTDLQRILLEAVGKDTVHLGMRYAAIEETDSGVTIQFENGHQATGDVLVGADGIHSTIRDYVVGHPVTLRYANYVNWNGTVDFLPELIEPGRWAIYVGDSKRVSLMSVGGDRGCFVCGAPMAKGATNGAEHSREELAKVFAGWPQRVQTLIKNMDPQKINRVEIHDIDPLDHLTRGRTVLLGDAGHATTPTLGQGGCQAMEDAEVLTRYLVTTNISVADALKRYETERKKRTAFLVLKARERTATIYGKDPSVTHQWYKDLKVKTPEEITGNMARIALGGPMG